MKEFAERLKELRINEGLTQRELAEKLNIRQQSYARYERNTGEPSLETFVLISRIFHVSLEYLVGLED